MKLRLLVGKSKGVIADYPRHHAVRLLESNMAEEVKPEELPHIDPAAIEESYCPPGDEHDHDGVNSAPLEVTRAEPIEDLETTREPVPVKRRRRKKRD